MQNENLVPRLPPCVLTYGTEITAFPTGAKITRRNTELSVTYKSFYSRDRFPTWEFRVDAYSRAPPFVPRRRCLVIYFDNPLRTPCREETKVRKA